MAGAGFSDKLRRMNFALFIAAALVLLITPGPSVLFIVARSVEQGVKAGLVSVVGMAAGGTVHVAAAALGVSAILLSSALLFTVVKYVGAVYLIYLGIRTLLSARQAVAVEVPEARPLRTVFFEAVTVQILNPKAALFFFAFLPQFVAPDRGAVPLQILMLGGIYHGLALITDSAYAIAAGRLGLLLRGNRRLIRLQRQVSGATYIGIGLVTAGTGSGK